MFKKVSLRLSGLLMLGVLLMSGCGEVNTSVDTQIDNVPHYRYSGFLMAADRQNASSKHYLFRKDDPSVPVQSLSFNLDDEKFLGKEVEVSGVAADSGGEVFVLDIQSINVIGGEMETNDKDANEVKTAEWTTFSDADLGFQISHKDDWKVDKKGNSVVFTVPELDGEEVKDEIRIVELANGEPVDLVGRLGGEQIDIQGFSARRIGKKQYEAYEKDGEEGIVYYVPREGRMYEISYSPENGVIKDVYRNLFFEMLLTLDFYNYGEIDSTDGGLGEGPEVKIESEVKESDDREEVVFDPDSLSEGTELFDGYRRFESLPFKFQAQYPKSWYYSGKKNDSGEVRHQYLFSNEPLDEGEELIVLDVLNASLPSGSRMKLGGNEAVMITKGGKIMLYVEGKEGQSYRFTGSADYKDIMLTMASSVTD